MPEQFSQPRRKHILSIALEDYFHGPAFSKVISRKRWGHFETRFEQNCLDVLEKLDRVGSVATFFANSWIARRRPDLLKEVVRRGHEIALAGQRGVSFRFLSREALREQLLRDRAIVEQACRKRVVGFRVTDVFLGPSDLWALEELARNGFLYDSSFSPFLRAFSAEPWRHLIHENRFSCGPLWEVPLASEKIAGLMIPIAGGNYFRQFPEWLVNRMLNRWDRRSAHPLVLYFRLWDFDPLQPRLRTGSLWRDFRHYRNGERMVETLNTLLARFRFASIADHLELTLPAVAPLPASEHAAVTQAAAGYAPRIPISIIVPCFNEELGIPYLASSLRQLKENLGGEYDLQFILVDDGSRDRTWEVLNQCFSGQADTLLLRHPRNRGVSAAIMTGLEQAREIACSMDCDCSYDPNELKLMLRRMRDGVDLVTASPYHPAGSVLNVPRWRLFLSRCSCSLYRMVTGRKLYTFTACMRVYRRSATVHIPLQNGGFLGVAELISRLVLEGKQVEEHPATLEVRIFGQSSMKVLRTILGHLRLLSQLAWIRLQNRRPPTVESGSRLSPQRAKVTTEL
jgi:polysaccharide deacetylase family protein (PEP-CTERM system associated)